MNEKRAGRKKEKNQERNERNKEIEENEMKRRVGKRLIKCT